MAADHPQGVKSLSAGRVVILRDDVRLYDLSIYLLHSFPMCCYADRLTAFQEQCGYSAETWAHARENEDISHTSLK